MLLLGANNALNDGLEAGTAGGVRFQIAFAHRQRKHAVLLQVPCGLVVSSDGEVRQKLAQALRPCALAPVLVSTVAESAAALAGHEVLIVVCNELLDDGRYEDVVQLLVRSEMQVPLIVVSRTGDWPGYVTAMSGGLFDYLAFPPIPEDLRQTIRNALLSRERGVEKNGETT
jgi:DNA-binding NtrC family response regulator